MANWGRECRVRFERRRFAAEPDEMNNPVIEGWDPIATVWGYIRPVGDREKVEGAQVNRVIDDRFTVRWRQVLADLTSDCQAVCEGVTYTVASVLELTEVDGRPSRREWLRISGQAKPDIETSEGGA